MVQKKDTRKLQELSEEIKSGEDRRGIIYAIQNETFTFMHQSFAEYFASNWFVKQLLSENFSNKTDLNNISNAARAQKLKDFLETYYFQLPNFRNLFDLISCEKCESNLKEIFQCTIHCDFAKFEDKAKLDLDLLFQTDPFGRNVAHMFQYNGHLTFLRNFCTKKTKSLLLQKKDNLFSKTAMEYSWQKYASNKEVQLLNRTILVNLSIEDSDRLCSGLLDQTAYLHFFLLGVCDKETTQKLLLPRIEKYKEVLAPDLYKQVLAKFRIICGCWQV